MAQLIHGLPGPILPMDHDARWDIIDSTFRSCCVLESVGESRGVSIGPAIVGNLNEPLPESLG